MINVRNFNIFDSKEWIFRLFKMKKTFIPENYLNFEFYPRHNNKIKEKNDLESCSIRKFKCIPGNAHIFSPTN